MNYGLVVFIVVVLIDVCGLVLDYTLLAMGLTTVTNLVRRGNTELGVAIVVLQLIGAAGLCCHFWGVSD